MSTKTIAVKGGVITFSLTPDFFKGVDEFNQLFHEETEKCLARSRAVNGQKVDCWESVLKLMQKFDDMFGVDACKKVFGVGYVGFDAFSEFFDKLEPLVEKWVKE